MLAARFETVWGCSFNVTPLRHWFSDLKEVNSGKVLIRNDYKCLVKGICFVELYLDDGTIKVLEDVRHMPKLKRNLISLVL